MAMMRRSFVQAGLAALAGLIGPAKGTTAAEVEGKKASPRRLSRRHHPVHRLPQVRAGM